MSEPIQPPNPEQEPRFGLDPQIWLGCLAAYNDGELHGEWIRAGREDDEVYEDVQRILSTSPVPNAEEHFIADFQEFGGYQVHEYEPIDRVAKVGRAILQHGAGMGLWLGLLQGEDQDVLLEQFEQHYIGEFADEDGVKRHLEEMYEVESLVNRARSVVAKWAHIYIDFDTDAWVRDLQLNSDIIVSEGQDGKTYAFWQPSF